MTRIRRIATLGMAALVALSLAAAPASAKKKPDSGSFSYVAQIDCGDGPREVGSSDDLETGTKYRPIAWNVSGEGFAVNESNGKANKHAATCAYDDGVATGTVTLKKA